MAQIPDYGRPYASNGWGDDPLYYPPGGSERPGTYLARLMDPALFGQNAPELKRPPPGQWLNWLMQPTRMAWQAPATAGSVPADAWRNPVLSPRGSVPLPRPAAPGGPRTIWRGQVLPVSGDEYGNIHFDTDAGVVGSTKRAVMMPGRVYMGEVDPNSDEAFEAIMDMAGMAGLGPVGGAINGGNALRLLESRNARLYDPPVLRSRSFDKDYPHGALADEAGNLTRDIEGRPLVAQRVVGRKVVGGEDQALPPAEYDAIAERSIGSISEAVPSREIGGGYGRYIASVDRRSGELGPGRILIDRSLPAQQASRVLGHELAHAIDELSGQIGSAGLNEELRAVYNTLNNPSQSPRAKPMGPENFKYKGADVQRELVAEAIRAYMTDPNYLKTVAPKTAAAIRKAVNSNPRLNKIIQFNMGGVPMPGAPWWADEDFQRAYRAGYAT